MSATTGDVGRGSGGARGARPSPLQFGHQSRGRFGLVVLGCWTIGFFGLGHGRFSVVQLLMSAGAVLLWLAAAAYRRRIETARERWILASGHPSTQPSRNVRRLDATR